LTDTDSYCIQGALGLTTARICNFIILGRLGLRSDLHRIIVGRMGSGRLLQTASFHLWNSTRSWRETEWTYQAWVMLSALAYLQPNKLRSTCQDWLWERSKTLLLMN